MAVKVQFEIGHTSKLRTKKTAEGFTHDWELYVKGVDRAEIHLYVEKVVFNLHSSFTKPKRAIKDPPFMIQESGYAGFMLPIDIYFRNRDEPKRVQFAYDLDLQQTGPPHHRYEIKKFIFENPSEEFRQKLIKGGGVPVSGVVGGSIHAPVKAAITQPMPSVLPALEPVPKAAAAVSVESTKSSKHKSSSSESKKHKSRYKEESKNNAFANLFGTPIHKTPTDSKSESSSLSNEKISKEKDYSAKSGEKLEKKDKQKSSKNVQNKVKSSSAAGFYEKAEKRYDSDKSKAQKLSDKERVREREKEEINSNRPVIQKHADLLKKADVPSSVRPEEQSKKEKSENSEKGKMMMQSSSKLNGKKSKKEKKDKDRKKEGSVKKYHTVLQENSIDSQTMKDLFASEDRPSRDASRDLVASPSMKSSFASSKSNHEIRETDVVEKKTYEGSKEKKYAEKESLKVKEKESKSSHKYKKKNKSKYGEHEKREEKRKKTEEHLKDSKDVDLTKNNPSNSSSTVSNRSKTPTETSESSKSRSKESSQPKKDAQGNKIKSSSKSENSEEKQTKGLTSSSLNPESSDSIDHFPKGSTSALNQEESSNCSFPDLTMKSQDSYKSPKTSSDQANKASSRSKDKHASDKQHKKEKRRRFSMLSNATTSPSGTSFVEPNSKQIKLEQATKSPESSTRTSSSANANPAFDAGSMQATNSPSQVMQYVNNVTIPLSGEYFNELQELQNKIMALQDVELQQVVELIASTGCYEITAKTFDFDLCRLDRNIVQRLQDLLGAPAVF